VQSVDEIFLAGLLGLSMDGPAAYLCGVRPQRQTNQIWYMSSILIPASGPDDWARFLADPGHWRSGYSAKCLACCWHAANGDFPPEIRTVLRTSPLLATAEILVAIPEHQVRIPGSGRASQTDLWILARTDAALASIAVEGKVAEPFGETVGDWLSDESANKQTRLKGLAEILGVETIPGDIRYQLVHRTASAVLEARRFLASHAVMLVHSFSQHDQWFEDFRHFVMMLGGSPRKDSLVVIPTSSGPTLHVGWVRGAEQFLSA